MFSIHSGKTPSEGFWVTRCGFTVTRSSRAVARGGCYPRVPTDREDFSGPHICTSVWLCHFFKKLIFEILTVESVWLRVCARMCALDTSSSLDVPFANNYSKSAAYLLIVFTESFAKRKLFSKFLMKWNLAFFLLCLLLLILQTHCQHEGHADFLWCFFLEV